MAFKGTPTRTARAIAEEIEDVGGYINAYTGKEMTAYYARVLEADVDRALDILADIVLNPLFEVPDIEVERGVILQEIGQALDTPDDIIFDWLQEAAYPGQPFGRTILGPAERVSGFGAAGPRGLRGRALRAGPDDPGGGRRRRSRTRCARLAERHFGHLERRPALPVLPARFAGGERREARDLEQVHMAMAFEAPACARTPPMPRRSTRRRSAAACRRGCSRSCASGAGSATPSSPRPGPTRTPGSSRSTPAPGRSRSAS